MKIYSNKKQLNHSLIFGIIWVVLGTVSIVGRSENPFLSGFLIIGIFYLAIYFVQKNVPYVLITDDMIQVNSFTAKKIYLRDIVEIAYFAGDYIIKSHDKKLTIDTNSVDSESLPNLKIFIADLKERIENSET